MRAHVRFVGLLMVVVLLVAVATAGPVTYIVTGDDAGNSYYLKSMGDGTLELQTLNGDLNTEFNWGTGIGTLTNKENYDFVVGTGSTGGPEKKIYLYEGTSGNGNPFPNAKIIGEWSLGDYPADMPVANFHGKVFDVDTLDDFMMVQYPSQDVGLYMNDGEGGFVPSKIEGAAPPSPVGADAADINHDGIADFVVAPTAPWVQGEPPYSYYIHVNLGLGNNEFTKSEIATRVITPYWGGTPYWGITAADFDGDYKVDLIATIADENGEASGFDFYKGNGEGVFTWADRFGVDLLLSTRSPVDNYDLDGDSDQDLVAANPGYVIVGLNKHYGQFIDGEEGKFTFTTYPVQAAGTGLKSIAAPPVFPNKDPFAYFSVSPALPEHQKVKIDTTLTFSSEDPAGVSYDPEGKDLTFGGYFPDDDTTETVTGTGDGTAAMQFTHLFETPGTYNVELTIKDTYDVTVPETVTVKVNYPPVAKGGTYSTTKNTKLEVNVETGVLAPERVTDEDQFADPVEQFTAELLADNTAIGDLSFNADGSFTYTPDQDQLGTDSFDYRIFDGYDWSDQATVTITVNPSPTWKVNIFPDLINLKSNGMFMAFVIVEKPYSATDLQTETVKCEEASAIRVIRNPRFPQMFVAVFKTSDLGLNTDLKKGKHGDSVNLDVTGNIIYNGVSVAFSGTDKVRVISAKSKFKDDTEKWDTMTDKHLWNKLPRDWYDKKDRETKDKYTSANSWDKKWVWDDT